MLVLIASLGNTAKLESEGEIYLSRCIHSVVSSKHTIMCESTDTTFELQFSACVPPRQSDNSTCTIFMSFQVNTVYNVYKPNIQNSKKRKAPTYCLFPST